MAEGQGAKQAPPHPMPPAREHIREAIVDVALSGGLESATVEMVVERAGVERGDFYRFFEDLDACYLDVYLDIADEFEHSVFSAFDNAPTWRDGIRAGAYAVARYIHDKPRETAFSLQRRFETDDVAAARRESQFEQIVDRIDLGRQELDDPDSMTRFVAEGTLGSLYEMTVRELEGRETQVEDLVPDLVYLMVRPYVGHEVAMEELTMPPPPPEPAEGGD